MIKKKNPHFNQLTNIIFYPKLLFISLFLFISKFPSIHNQSLTSPYPSCFQMNDNILLMVNQDGIFFCDLLLQQTYQYIPFKNSNTYYVNNMDKLIISQYDEEFDGHIITIIKTPKQSPVCNFRSYIFKFIAIYKR